MITGHFAAGLALKQQDNSIPLWVLFLGSQLVDVMFMVLLLGNVEHLRIVPDINPSNDIDLYYYPFTHGLLPTPIWAALLIGVYALFKPVNKRVAMGIFLAVTSHWLFDLFVHTPDLPLLGDNYKVGFGLWNFPLLAIGLEAVFIVGGLCLYLSAKKDATNRHKFFAIGLAVLLIIPAATAPLAPTPGSPTEVAIGCLIMYAFFTAAAFLLERVR